jgi:hypothetical protein
VECPSCGNRNRPGAKFCDSCGVPLEAAPENAATREPPSDLPGSFADGRYRVRRFLGERGRKRVYLARDEVRHRARVAREERRDYEQRGDQTGRVGHSVAGDVVGGAALGAITPFCCCSGIPVLAGLLRSGAPFGPTMTFLFASPLLDPVVLGLLAFVLV